MRMSVIFKSEAIEFRLTFWGYASKSAQRPSPAAAAPIPRNLRRPNFLDIPLLLATKIDSSIEPDHCMRTPDCEPKLLGSYGAFASAAVRPAPYETKTNPGAI